MEVTRCFTLNEYLKQTYGEKLYKLALNPGTTCPNRDGTLDSRGCIFCSAGGSGDFAQSALISVSEQIDRGKELVSGKFHGSGYIAYFQAYTGTYGPIDHLRKIYLEAAEKPEIRILSIATRPDCLGPEVLDLLSEINRIKPVWIELGLQTIHERTAALIRRCYDLPVFEQAVADLTRIGIPVIVHTILGLPGETEEDMLATIDYLNKLPIFGIKLQLLHVLKGTDLEEYYTRGALRVMEKEEYFSLLARCVCRLRPDIVIHRLTGDGPKSLLIAPLWTADKRSVLNGLRAWYAKEDIRQGRDYVSWTNC